MTKAKDRERFLRTIRLQQLPLRLPPHRISHTPIIWVHNCPQWDFCALSELLTSNTLPTTCTQIKIKLRFIFVQLLQQQ
eukprot:gene12592-8630_t